MMPVVFEIPGIHWPIPGYGLMLMIGFLLAIIWAARRAERSGANPEVVLNCGFIALIGGVVGSRAMYVIHYWDEQFKIHGSALNVAWAVINVSRGGLEFYGGFILACVGVLFYLWRWKYSIRWYMDIVAPSVVVGLAFGRLGCFLNGCCWGNTCELPWAVRFPFGSMPQQQEWFNNEPGAGLPQELVYFTPSGLAIPLSRDSMRATDAQIAAADRAEATAQRAFQEYQAKAGKDSREEARLKLELNMAQSALADVRAVLKKYHLGGMDALRAKAARHRSRPLHPTQIYSFITAGLIALLLNELYWRRTRDGQVICTLFLIEPISRWVLELIRGDNPHDVGIFTISQSLAMGMTLLGLLGLWRLRAMPPRSPYARLWEPPVESDPAKTAKDSKKNAAGAAG